MTLREDVLIYGAMVNSMPGFSNSNPTSKDVSQLSSCNAGSGIVVEFRAPVLCEAAKESSRQDMNCRMEL